MTDDTSTSTRDLVVETKTALNAHLTDCSAFRGRISESLRSISEKLAAQDSLQITQTTRQNYIIGLIVGGYFVINWIIEHAPAFLKTLGH